MPYVLDVMHEVDIQEVAEVEKRCFATPWPIAAYRRELRNPNANRYLVVRWSHPDGRSLEQNGSSDLGSSLRRSLSRVLPGVFHEPPSNGKPATIAGFSGLWLMPDEAHVTTIGVSPEHRGKGIGEMLFLAMVDLAIERGVTWLTLEVRVSNGVAQSLYRKYGMQTSGIRRHYYSDNGEDAYIMTAGPMQAEPFRARLAELREQFNGRMARLQAEEAGAVQKNQ